MLDSLPALGSMLALDVIAVIIGILVWIRLRKLPGVIVRIRQVDLPGGWKWLPPNGANAPTPPAKLTVDMGLAVLDPGYKDFKGVYYWSGVDVQFPRYKSDLPAQKSYLSQYAFPVTATNKNVWLVVYGTLTHDVYPPEPSWAYLGYEWSVPELIPAAGSSGTIHFIELPWT